MKKLFTFIFLSFFLVSCFEVVEEITVNNDGSGSINLTFNFSKSKTKLNSIMLLDSINKYKVPSKSGIKKYFEDTTNKIKNTAGITNVQYNSNFTDYIFNINCDFNNINTLNEVISNFSSLKEQQQIKNNKHFTYNKATKTFTRNYHYNLENEFKKVENKDRTIFDDANYTTIYRFESPIISSKNQYAKLSKNEKALMLRISATDIIKNQKTIKNTIKLQ